MQILANEILQQLPTAILPRLISLFGATTPELITEIQQQAANGDLLAMAQTAHKLKGSCLSLGAEKMADLCQKLQHKGEYQDTVGMDEYLAELAAIYPVTLAALQQIQT